MTDLDSNRQVASTALEQVCSRGDMTLAHQCYAEDFADYVGSLEYPASTASSGRPPSTGRCLRLAFDVVDQVAEGIGSPAASCSPVQTAAAT